jgi:DNA-binding MarR family transcriptional regulator
MTDYFSDPDLDVRDLTTIIEEFTAIFIRFPSVERLRFSTLSVLHTLTRLGPMRLTELTATEQLTQPAISQMVRQLEDDGLLERRPDPRDARAVLIQLTTRGAQIIEARRTARVEWLSSLLDRLSPEERAAIASAVPALAHAIELVRTPELPLHVRSSSESSKQQAESSKEKE